MKLKSFINSVYEMGQIKLNLNLFSGCYFLLYILLFFSGKFPISNIDKFILFLLTFVASQLFMIAIKTRAIIEYFRNKTKYLFIFLILYVSFASIGNYLFLHPVNIVSVRNWSYFILFALWLIPIVVSVLYLLEFYQSKLLSGKNRTEGWGKQSLIWFLFFSICFIAATLYLIAYNPAIMSWDSYDQWSQANGIIPLVNWHPVFHTLIIRFLISIIPSPSFVAFVQILFFSAIISASMVLLYTRGFNLIFLVPFCIIIAIIPSNGIQVVTLWKDIPYSISLLWLTLLFAKIISRNQLYTKISFIIEIALALICVYFFRQNGIIVYIFTVIALLAIFLKRFQWKPLMGVIASLFIIILIQFPYYKALSVESAPQSSMKYFALLNDIVGVYFSGGNVSKKTEGYLKEVVDIDNYRKSYNSYYTSFHFYKTELANTKSLDFIGMYIDTFLCNPILMTNNILCRLDLYWSIPTGKDAWIGGLNFRDCEVRHDFEPKNFNFHRQPNFLTGHIDKISNIIVLHNLLLVLFWRFGIWIALLFTTFLFVIKNKKYEILFLGLPILSNILSLALSSGWMDYRYGWSISITVPFIIFFSLVISPKNTEKANTCRYSCHH